ncbi:MAG: hypothetical protein ACRDN9_21895 [Streptosporangiaceae bacterium]
MSFVEVVGRRAQTRPGSDRETRVIQTGTVLMATITTRCDKPQAGQRAIRKPVDHPAVQEAELISVLLVRAAGTSNATSNPKTES